MDGKKNSLINNTAIYMVGSALSKVLNLLLLPYISVKLSSEQYGVFDLIQTITGIILPICTLQAIEAAFRYVYLEADNKKGKILTNVWLIVGLGTSGASMLLTLINGLFLHLSYIRLLIMYLIFNVLLNMYQRIARCYNKNKVFALSGIIQTFVMLILQLSFLQWFDMKEDGLVYAYMVSVIVVVIFVELSTHSLGQLKFKDINRDDIKKIVSFSVPLIPNSISWWGVSSLNRMIIVSQIGYAANGIFSMANKFSSMVTMVTSTFQLALQEYILEEKDNENRVQIVSDIFNKILVILGFIVAIGTLFQQIFFKYLISLEYAESYYYIPITMISAAFSAMSSFYGVGYFVYEKTSGAFKTTTVCAALNLLLCFATIKIGGIYAIATAGAISYLIMWIIRHFTMRDYFRVDIKITSVAFFVLLSGSSTIVYYFNQVLFSVVLMVIYSVLFVGVFGRDAIRFIEQRRSKKKCK